MKKLLVAKIRATRKNQKLVVNGEPMGGTGVDGNKWYDVHKIQKGVWECSCMRHTIERNRAKKTGKRPFPCKHLFKLWREWKARTIVGTDIVVHEPSAL